MNPSLTPSICLVALACMVAAGSTHWWSVRQFEGRIDPTKPPAAEVAAPAPSALAEATPAAPAPAVAAPAMPAPPVGESLAMQQQFYQELLREMQQLRTQNRDLLNQVAETNRDLMKLEFRVDTHSEQFRPLPVSDDRFDVTLDTTPVLPLNTSFDDGPGLLPPRAEPVNLPYSE